MNLRRRLPSVLLAAALAALAFSGAAAAKSYSLPQANVSVQVTADGSLVVDELITYAFSGPFSGGYRDIPLRKGESIDQARVSENGRPYRPGGCTVLGCTDAPGTFGTTVVGNSTRIVWHYQASDELRTFAVHYRLRGVAVAYDDVVDVNLQVWGSEWQEPLGRLTATEAAPGKILRAWGHPVYVRGDVQLAGKRVLLRALNVPAHQFVELRTVVPRSAFTSTAGMRVVSGNGLPSIVAAETADAAAFARDRQRIDNAKQHPWRYVLTLLLLGTIPAFLVVGGVFWFFGREVKTGYDREYEQEPPTETEPALVPTLLRQGGEAGSFEFTATLFDLIRRGVFTSTPVTTERATWGGLRKESVSDLELAAGKADVALTPWESSVSDVVQGVIKDGPERLSRFREKIEDDREAMSKHFTSFKANVGTEVGNRRWFISRGAVPLAVALLLFAGIGALLVFLAANGWRSVYPRWSDIVLVGLAIASFVNAAIVLGSLTQRKLWRRRSRDGEVEAGAGRPSVATSPTSRASRRRHPRRSHSGSACSSTGSHSASPNVSCRPPTWRCRRSSPRHRRSTGSRAAAGSAVGRRPWASAISRRASARRSHPRRPDRVASAAASRVEEAEGAEAAEAAPGSYPRRASS